MSYRVGSLISTMVIIFGANAVASAATVELVCAVKAKRDANGVVVQEDGRVLLKIVESKDKKTISFDSDVSWLNRFMITAESLKIGAVRPPPDVWRAVDFSDSNKWSFAGDVSGKKTSYGVVSEFLDITLDRRSGLLVFDQKKFFASPPSLEVTETDIFATGSCEAASREMKF